MSRGNRDTRSKSSREDDQKVYKKMQKAGAF